LGSGGGDLAAVAGGVGGGSAIAGKGERKREVTDHDRLLIP